MSPTRRASITVFLFNPMTTTSEKELKTQLLQFFAKHPSEQFKPQVIARRLALKSQDEIRSLNKVLNEMYQSKQIDRGTRKKYGHSIPPPSQRVAGILSITKQGNGVVTLTPPQAGTVTINQRFLGNALSGDSVSVVLFAQQKDDEEKDGQKFEGEIVEVIKRSEQSIVGVFEKSRSFFFVVPDNRRITRDIYIPKGKTKGAQPGQKVVAQIDAWESKNLNPEGHIVEILGKSGEVGAEMTGVAREFGLPLQFPRNVLAEAETINSAITQEDLNDRLDLRSLECFTIDPEDAKDFDDAVSLTRDAETGHWELTVHIADV